MLRECARYEALAKIMIYSDDFYNFFRYVEVSTFDIASDAFSTFKVTTGLLLWCTHRFIAIVLIAGIADKTQDT